MSDGALAGRHAVVTGAARGIGAAIAHTLAGAGARVSLIGRNLEKLQSTAAAIRAEHPQSETVTLAADGWRPGRRSSDGQMIFRPARLGLE